jgi:hypothetical protein
MVLLVSNGHFSIAWWTRSAGFDFGGAAISIEDVAEKWQVIEGI